MREILDRVQTALQQAGLSALRQFPAGDMPLLTGAAAAVDLQSIRAANGSFLDYLGTVEDPERGPLERYGKKMEGTVRVCILAPDAEALRQAATDAITALGFGLPLISVEEVSAEQTVFDPAADCFRKDVFLRFGAYFCAESAEDSTEFTDFKLEGDIR